MAHTAVDGSTLSYVFLSQSLYCSFISFVTAKNDPFDPFGDGGAERSASKTPVDVSFCVYIGYKYVYVPLYLAQ